MREVVLRNFASKAESYLLVAFLVGPKHIFRCDMGLAFGINPHHALLQGNLSISDQLQLNFFVFLLKLLKPLFSFILTNIK